ncbi:MAG: glycosyltransferase [Promethearchaeota archaeon]
MVKVKSIIYSLLLLAIFEFIYFIFPPWLNSPLKLKHDANIALLLSDFGANWTRIFGFTGIFILFLMVNFFGIRFFTSLEPTYKVKERFQPPISIMIASRDEKALLERTLDSIMETDYPKENIQMIIVTSGSSDGSADFCREYARGYSNIEWVIIDEEIEKKGKPPALNLGLQQVKHDFIVLYDAGSVLLKDTLSLLVSPMKDEKNHATTGPTLVRNWKKNRLTRGAAIDYIIISGGGIYSENMNKLGKNCYLLGKNFCIRKGVLDSLNGFNENSLTEDLFLTAMLELHGKKIKFVPQAKNYEDVPSTWEILKKQRTRWVGGYSGDMPEIMEMKVGKNEGKKIMISRNMTMLALAHVDIWIFVHLFFIALYLLIQEYYLLTWTLVSFSLQAGYLLNGIRKYGDGHYSCLFFLAWTSKIHGFMFRQQFKLPEVSWEKTPMLLERSPEEIESLSKN